MNDHDIITGASNVSSWLNSIPCPLEQSLGRMRDAMLGLAVDNLLGLAVESWRYQ